ncbi:hypothetical protein [Streptomyces sp. SID5643]|nr:hypothetical protein [Streptomyces sp. SID5643]MZF87522.1 hypothetical protein [Streptomyces sp. SID5643]
MVEDITLALGYGGDETPPLDAGLAPGRAAFSTGWRREASEPRSLR